MNARRIAIGVFWAVMVILAAAELTGHGYMGGSR